MSSAKGDRCLQDSSSSSTVQFKQNGSRSLPGHLWGQWKWPSTVASSVKHGHPQQSWVPLSQRWVKEQVNSSSTSCRAILMKPDGLALWRLRVHENTGALEDPGSQECPQQWQNAKVPYRDTSRSESYQTLRPKEEGCLSRDVWKDFTTNA